MDDESSYSQLVNISGEEIEDEEAGNVKEGSLFYKKDKQCPNGCMDFVPPKLLQKVCLTIPSHFTLSYIHHKSQIIKLWIRNKNPLLVHFPIIVFLTQK
jgi:hypothetical protein